MRRLILTLCIFTGICFYAHASTTPGEKKSAKVHLKTKSNGSIIIRSTAGNPVSFFLFDLDGRLVHQLAIKEDTKETITGLKKGSYLYNMLNEDQVLGEGKLTIK
jgi:hypothetical protein